MSFADLNKKYEDFINHEKFPEVEKSTLSTLQYADLGKDYSLVGSWIYNLAFLSSYFETPKNVGVIVQSPYRFTIEYNGELVELNLNNAPNFRDQDEYLNWLHKQIYK